MVRRFYAAPIVAILGTYALGLIIRESVRGLIGGLYISVPEPIGGSITIGTLHFATWRFVIVIITALVMAGSYALLAHTSFGLRIRASLENPSLARASGISTGTIYSVTFAFGAALAGLAGALIVPVFSLFADLGIRFLIQGFVAVMVGGVGSFAGPVAGASVIGTLSAALPWVMAPVIADVLVFVLAIIFIKFRPQGLDSDWIPGVAAMAYLAMVSWPVGEVDHASSFVDRLHRRMACVPHIGSRSWGTMFSTLFDLNAATVRAPRQRLSKLPASRASMS